MFEASNQLNAEASITIVQGHRYGILGPNGQACAVMVLLCFCPVRKEM